ncbi:MAG: hypothetical protein ABEJ30_08830 [Halorientalis sp.]
MTEVQSDKAVGLGLAFGVLSVVGALVMYLQAAQQVVAGWGFALAVVAGCLAVAALHLFS